MLPPHPTLPLGLCCYRTSQSSTLAKPPSTPPPTPPLVMLLLALQATASSAAAGGRLHFLNFFDQLLTSGTEVAEERGGACSSAQRLLSDLEFDGTHLSPRYVRYLDASLP